jgi:hypothetical protein
VNREDQKPDASNINKDYELPATVLDPNPAPTSPPSENAKRRPKQTKTFLQRLRKPIPILTVVIALAAIAQVVVTRWQLNEMKSGSAQTDKLIEQATKQSEAAVKSAQAAQAALALARENFRQDQRPYITLGPAGSGAKIELVPAGEYAGRLSVELYLANFGKSPGMEIARDARLAIGSSSGKQIRLHPAIDQRGRIIAPGDQRVSIYAYSEEVVSKETFNDIVAGNVILIAYGHIEYTDLLSEPRPRYLSEFCTGIVQHKGG